jgi:DNA-binding response OmpR family regulator
LVVEMKTPALRLSFPNVWTDNGDYVVGLRPLEYRLLDYMLEHRGEVVTAYECAIHVWERNPAAASAFGDGMVRTVLSRLRAKLPELLIGRVRGVGWVLA